MLERSVEISRDPRLIATEKKSVTTPIIYNFSFSKCLIGILLLLLAKKPV